MCRACSDLRRDVAKAGMVITLDVSVSPWKHMSSRRFATISRIFFRQVPKGDWISDRTGLTFNDCTSAAFAMDIPWNKVLNTFTPCTWVVLNYSPSLVVPARLAATTQGYY